MSRYRQGVEWIAWNDEPGERDPEVVSGYTTTLLLADLFGKHPNAVARDIVRFREEHKI